MKKIWQKGCEFFSKHIQWWQDYITEISVVIISIAATFYGENVISGYQEHQEDRRVMQMVLNELRENEQELESLQKRCSNDIRFSSLLHSYLEQGDSLNLLPDTLEKYQRYHYLYPQWIFKQNAFDVIKGSGVMQRVDDKELLILIFDCYDQIALVRQMGDHFKDERFAMIMNYTSIMPTTTLTGTLQWKQIASYPPFLNYLYNRFKYNALNVRAFGKRAWIATDSVLRRIEETYDLAEYNANDSETH